jgi:hypothetical protein
VAGDWAEDSWTYAYDDLDRLLSAANTNTPALGQTFTYDLAGNLTANSSLGAYVYPAQGPASVQPHAVQSAGDWGFTYDANGNQTIRTALGTPDRTITYAPDNFAAGPAPAPVGRRRWSRAGASGTSLCALAACAAQRIAAKVGMATAVALEAVAG